MSATAFLPERLDAASDEQLMLSYVGGDSAAFDVLYTRYESGILRFVRRLLGVRLAAEVGEVFQETWSRIIATRDDFVQQSATWRVWAFAIACNLAMDQLRLSGRDSSFYAHDEDGDGLDAARLFGLGALRGGDADAHPSAEELAFWRAAGRRLLACLDELTDEQRAVFLLHQEDGFTTEALAGTLGIDPATAGTRLRQGFDKLEACMERYLDVLERRA